MTPLLKPPQKINSLKKPTAQKSLSHRTSGTFAFGCNRKSQREAKSKRATSPTLYSAS
jgi:hypothetical protein